MYPVHFCLTFFKQICFCLYSFYLGSLICWYGFWPQWATSVSFYFSCCVVLGFFPVYYFDRIWFTAIITYSILKDGFRIWSIRSIKRLDRWTFVATAAIFLYSCEWVSLLIALNFAELRRSLLCLLLYSTINGFYRTCSISFYWEPCFGSSCFLICNSRRFLQKTWFYLFIKC